MTDLHKFCAGTECAKNRGIGLPWSEGEYSYASQGHLLLRVSRQADVPENQKAPKMAGTDLAKWFDAEPLSGWHPVPECNVGKIACPECKGQGKLYGEPCEDCDGTGEVVDDQGIKVGGIWFSNWLLEKIGALPGCEIGVNDVRNPSRLRFDGGDGLLMPRLSK